MNKAKFTPGPWCVCNGTDIFTECGSANNKGVIADRNDGWHVADCLVGGTFVDGEITELSYDEQKANAHIIAAAPELYYELLDRYTQGLCGCGHPSCSRCQNDRETASVLSKARGE